jgi:RsiW-degrading membrane proteinase PrsW (M82 family)
MPQPDWRKLAQQGDPEAIALLLNRSLQPRGVKAKILLRENCLKILLASTRPLEQQAFVQFIQKQISSLGLDSITLVKVYGQQIGEAAPTWYQEFVPIVGKSRGAIVLVSNPEGNASNKGAIVKYRTETKPFFASLRTFQIDSVFPYRDVLNADLYRSNTARLLLFLGLFPLVINLLADQASLAQTAWLIGIYYASIWGVVLYNLIKPAQFSWGDMLRCLLFTAFISIPILLIIQRVPPFNTLYRAINGGLIPRMLGFVFGVGVLEEICKALPVYVLLLRPGKLNDPHTSAFYGAMSGLGFAIAEGAAYSLLYALGLFTGHLGISSYVAASTIRFVSLPLFHAMLAGIVGYFMGLAAINPSRQGALLFIGIAISATIHGFYNTFAGGIPGLLTVGFSILLFLTYLRRSKQMVDEMHQAERGHQIGQDKPQD